MMLNRLEIALIACTLCILPPGGTAAAPAPIDSTGGEVARRTLTIDDYFRISELDEPQISPDGAWIAYTVTTDMLDEDESKSRIWVVPTGGGEAVPMTAEQHSAWQPRWSPDGKYLAFLRDDSQGLTQIWLLPRGGGEARQLTDTAQGIGATVWFYDSNFDAGSYEWSPDGRRMVLVLKDPSPQELAAAEARAANRDYKQKTAPPWVINRRQFKVDYLGYLDHRRTHLYVLELDGGALTQITFGQFDDLDPVWSPDGSSIAFVSDRTADLDATYNSDIWVVRLSGTDLPAEPIRVSTLAGMDSSPSWSPDCTRIAHISAPDEKVFFYGTNHLAVSTVGSGETRILTRELDRNILTPEFAADGRIYFVLEDSGEQNLARIAAEGGEVERLIRGPRVVSEFDLGPAGDIAALVGEPQLPEELFVYSADRLQQRTFTNRELLGELRLGEVVEVEFESADGTPIEGFIIKPPDYVAGTRYPAILDIHGGPQAQYDHSFHFEGQLYAANGYLVIQPNPRGSTGYGQQFCLAIWQNWGGPDYEDVMAAVDDAIARGWADPERLAVTGWSYGGILTDHVITKTDRFKAAATGAGAALYVLNYGHDHYQRWWEYELGLPWRPESRKLWEELSPFYQLDRVTTPTLILGGEKDWNVPIINSEQLFQALARLGVETELVIYPGEHHGIDTPSHAKDLYERYLGWFGKYLKGEPRPDDV